MSLIKETVDPTSIQDEFDNLVTEMEQTPDQAFRLVPIPTADFPLTLRKIRRAARGKSHGVKVYTKTATDKDGNESASGTFTVAVIGLEAPIVRGPMKPREDKADAKTDGIDPEAAAQVGKPSKA